MTDIGLFEITNATCNTDSKRYRSLRDQAPAQMRQTAPLHTQQNEKQF